MAIWLMSTRNGCYATNNGTVLDGGQHPKGALKCFTYLAWPVAAFMASPRQQLGNREDTESQINSLSSTCHHWYHDHVPPWQLIQHGCMKSVQELLISLCVHQEGDGLMVRSIKATMNGDPPSSVVHSCPLERPA